jgi:DNA-binding Lrp family transcriptional regulator
MGEIMKAYVMIKIRTGDVADVVSHIRNVDGVVEAHMTFGPYDAIAVVEAVDIARLGAITASEIQPIPGVEQTLTCLAVDV